MNHLRTRRSLSVFFGAWASRSRTLLAAKSRSVNRICKNCTIVFVSWRVVAVWRIHIDAALSRALLAEPCVPCVKRKGDLTSEVSAAAASIASVIIRRPLLWPNVSTIKIAINQQLPLLSLLLGKSSFQSCGWPGLLKQTLKSLFKKIHIICTMSKAFRSWNSRTTLITKEILSKDSSFFDGSVSELIARSCVSLGRSHPLLLGYCAIKVTAHLCC
jgi:hypothetical protein